MPSICVSLLWILAVHALNASEAVHVQVTQVEHPIWTQPMKDSSPHAVRSETDNRTRSSTRFTRISIRNQHLEVIVAPELGMRVLNAIDLATGRSLSGTPDARQYETQDFEQFPIWTAGYLEHSFPYFEHGMFARQPAGWRIVEQADGGVQIAMTCRFSHWQHPRHMARHGNYSDRALSVIVELKPNQRRYRVTTRVDNPNPLPRSERVWTNHHLHTEGYDREHIIFPVGYVSTHSVWWANPYWIKPYHADGGEPWYESVSLFGIYSPHGFTGWHSSQHDDNSLIIKDPESCPGLKLYTGKDGFFELWVGTTTLFEHPGGLVAPYEPTGYSLDYYLAPDIGRVEFATRDLAMGIRDGIARLTGPVELPVRVRDQHGQIITEGMIGPGHAPLTLPAAWPLSVEHGGKHLATIALPLQHPDTSDLVDIIDAKGGEIRYELEEVSNTRREMTVRDAIPAAQAIVDGSAETEPSARGVLSLARACYRLGHFELTTALCARLPSSPETDYLRALVAWETGDPATVDFASAGLDSYYLRALQAHANGDRATALIWLDQLLAVRPQVWRPRLLQAYLANDLVGAQRLAHEQPASLDAHIVCELLGDPAAATATADLLRTNPDAAEQLAQFRAELEHGAWTHIRRYAPALPAQALPTQALPASEP